MKIGVCSDIKSAQTLKELGYDYIEYNMTSLAGMSESDFDAFKEKVRKSQFSLMFQIRNLLERNKDIVNHIQRLKLKKLSKVLL